MQLAADCNRGRGGGAEVRVFPETKHPAHFTGIGLPLEQAVLDALRRHDYAADGSPVFIQSFDPRNLQQLRGMTRLPLVQLLEHELGDLGEIAEYADAIGIAKVLATPDGIRAAHAVNLKVHVWTFRAENEFLPDDLKIGGSPAARGNLDPAIQRFLGRGIDGFFVDFPLQGVRVRDYYL